MKNCTICKTDLELIEYSKDKYRPDGIDATCKKCRKKQREKRIKQQEPEVVIQKICTLCKISSDSFNKQSKNKTDTICKLCRKKQRQEKKQKNIERILPDDYTKICNLCKIEKHKDDFYTQIYSSDGIGTYCIDCDKTRTKNWREKNPEKIKQYRSKEYFKNYKNRRESRPEVKLSENIRNRIRMALKRQKSKKYKNSYELIDCSPLFFKKWLEYQFNSKMTWKNHGKYWEIDHVIPCNFFDLKNRNEQLICFNWRNCRPLSSTENSSKRDKIQPLQILLQEIRVHYYERHIQIAGKP